MRPPVVARALVYLFSSSEDRAFLLDDLADRFREIAETEGLPAAKRWYWSQALSGVPWALRPDVDQIRRRSWEGLLGEVRFALRTLMQRPLYTVGVGGTLGLGLAAATVSFAVAWKVWLAPMPYPDPDRVVRLYEIEPPGPAARTSQVGTESGRQPLSPTLLGDFNSHSWRTIEAVSAVQATGPQLEWTRDGETQSISSVALSREGFGILGIVPLLGRLPTASQEILLAEQFWRTDLGGDPNVVGSAMDLGQALLRVVGVARLPSGYPGDRDIVRVQDWGFTEAEDRGFRVVEAIARVRPEYSVAEAKAELNAFVVALGEIHPEHRGWGADAVVLADDLMRPFRSVLVLLFAAGTIFLILAAVNVIGLVAARRVEGRQDRSIRIALGASEGRLLRDSLVESLLLAAVGAITGIVSAYWLIGPIRSMIPEDVPRLTDVAVTPLFVLGGVSIAMALGAVIGVSGYLVTQGTEPSVRRASAWQSVGVGGRRALVVGQVALTTLLTAGGATILHRVSTLRGIDLGYDPEGVSVTSAVPVGISRWPFARAVLEGLRARGISAAMATNTPMMGDEFPKVGMRADAASEEIIYDLHLVSPDYFSVMGIELLEGRDFGSDDVASSQRVVIVSEEFVDQYFPERTPVESVVGRVIAPLIYETTGPMVVGVVRSTRHQSPETPVEPEIYSPLSQLALDLMTLLVRGEPEQVAEAVSAVVTQIGPDDRWSPLVPYTYYLDEWFSPFRFQLLMIGALTGVGLMLASLGLYSLMAYQVATGRQELGIRKALGAPNGKIVKGVVARGMVMALFGAMIGLGAWYQLLPWTREFVDGIDSAGSLVPLSVALVVGGSCLFATLVPAVRATQVDLVVTLKAD